jgi:two-component system, cell cycle response regulator DivK
VSKKILVVDDQVDNRLIIADRLSNEFEIIEAASGLEGIALAESARPDLILMDLWLPDIDGYEATRRIKAVPELSLIPIIAVTSYALGGDREKALEAGCDDYVAKPFDPADLQALVRGYLR